MSHIVEIKTEVRDPISVKAACRKLGLPDPTEGVFKVFTTEVAGLGVELPDWRYPVVCELGTGNVRYDNFDQLWGAQEELDRFLQRYAVERATIEARRRGHTAFEQAMKDGSIKLTVQVGGAA